jgi:hypothetical protein
MGKETISETNGWFKRWKNQDNIVLKRMYGAEKSADFLAADEWIKREWPNTILLLNIHPPHLQCR